MFSDGPILIRIRCAAAIAALQFLSGFTGVPTIAQESRVETNMRLGAEAMRRKGGRSRKILPRSHRVGAAAGGRLLGHGLGPAEARQARRGRRIAASGAAKKSQS